jgi:hypothetical protein
MGAGISLGEEQIAEIVKRDLNVKHQTKMKTLPPCLPEYAAWRNFIAENHHEDTLTQIDRYKEKVIAYKTKG